MLSNSRERTGSSGIEIAVREDHAFASLYGRIDIDSSPAVRDRLLALLDAQYPKTVSIDLSAVTHMDSAGVATLIEALRTARAHQSELRLQGLHDQLLRLFNVTGLLSLFNRSTKA